MVSSVKKAIIFFSVFSVVVISAAVILIINIDKIFKDANSAASDEEYVSEVNSKGTTPGNAANFGHVTSQGDWLYYAPSEGIYRTNRSSGKTEQISNRCAIALNVVAEWLYFVDGSYDGGIYKVKLDGTNETQLSSVISYSMYVEDGWIYYIDQYWGGIIYKMKTDGSSVTKLTEENSNEFIVNGNTIYYLRRSDSCLCKVSTDGEDDAEFGDGYKGDDLALVGDRLVIAAPHDYLISVKLDGSDPTSFYSGNINRNYLNGYNGWVYYLETDFTQDEKSSAFCRIKPDGTERTEIYKINYTLLANMYVDVLDGYIYFKNDNGKNELCRVRFDGTGFENLG